MQPAREARQHLLRERRLARELVEDGFLRDVEQHRVGERLRHHDVGLLHEHQRLAERVARPDDLDDLLLPGRGHERQLHLPVDHEIEAGRRVALVEQDLPARHVQLGGARREAVELGRRELLEQRERREEGLGLDLRRHRSSRRRRPEA